VLAVGSFDHKLPSEGTYQARVMYSHLIQSTMGGRI
jgi:hypothetical protein